MRLTTPRSSLLPVLFRSAPLAFLALALAGLRLVQPHPPPAAGTVGALVAAGPMDRVTVVGVIVEPPAVYPDRGTTTLVLDASRPATGRVRVSLHWAAPGLAYGDRVVATGALVAPAGPTNPGQSDFRAALARHGIHALLAVWSPDRLRVTGHDAGSPVTAGLLAVRRWAMARLAASIGPPQSDLLGSIVFGLHAGFDPEVLEAFQLTGLMHVLVASGLNVGLLAWMGVAVFGWLGASRRFAAVLTLPVLVLYTLLCGADPPILRSTVMFALIVLAQALGRPGSPMNALGAAACLVLLADPFAPWDRSFQFSFAATFGVMALAPRIIRAWRPSGPGVNPGARRRRLVQVLVDAGACTIAAQLAMIPLLAAAFGSVPLLGAFANLLVTPVMGVLLGGGILLLAFAGVPGLGWALAGSLRWALTLVLAVVEAFARLPLASVVAPPFTATAWTAYLAWALGGLLWLKTLDRRQPTGADRPPPDPGRERWPRTVTLAGAAVLAALAWRAALAPPPGTLTITALDIGQGLATVIRLPSGRVVLWDAGPEFAGSTVVAPYLKHAGIGRLAGVLLTHTHTDHCGGMAVTLRQVRADWLALSGQGFAGTPDPYRQGGVPSPAFADTLAAARARRVPLRIVWDGCRIEGEPGVSLTLWHPPRGFMRTAQAKAKDENALVLAIRWRGATALLPGDIQARGEKRLLRRAAAFGPVGWLAASHHGSLYGNTRAWLAACAPRFAVASAGLHNRFGHPHRATVIRYRDQGTPLWVTGRAGAVTATTRGGAWTMEPSVSTFSGARRPLSGRGEADIVKEGTEP
jgi:competence protein ComEC